MGQITTQDVLAVIARAIKVDETDVTMEATMEDLEEWDSLAHLEVLVELDKMFDEKVGGITEMAITASVADILRVLKENELL
jgi:acyl carrier protein